MSSTRKIVYIIIGTVCLVLGTIGVFLPLLPTTPFWLLTCWFYIRSSEKLYNRVMRNPYFGNYIRAYMVDKSIPLRGKILSLTLMWASILLSCIFLVHIVWVRVLLLAISIGVSIHILSFPTRKEK
ncbi:YbaN family protein [Parabacteroides sp. OttesenSCG-928-G21]|nr:YbaN family protein [Parabacteroides sp. OttesenSCG-928-G21]